MGVHRADINQEEMVKALRSIGASVQILSQVGDGCPDLLVGYHGIDLLLEVKSKGGELSTEQLLWHKKWTGQVAVVWTVEEAIAVLNKKVRGLYV